MKVLLINGSPHEAGCTYTALCEVAGALNAEGVDTEVIHIGKKPISGCTACGGCFHGSGRCVLKGDVVNDIIEKAEGADGIVIGSPVHFASAGGSITAALDRVFYAGKCFAYKPGAAVVSARRAGTTAALEQLNKYFMIRNMPLVSSQYWSMVHGNTPKEVRKDEEGLQIMRTLGRNMAWLLKCIEAGKRAGLQQPEPEAEGKRTNFISY